MPQRINQCEQVLDDFDQLIIRRDGE